MALFRGSIENQIGTLNQVNEQIAKQKAMEQEIAMKKYLLGKEFGDDRLTGQATGTMQNTGLIPGMFSGIEDIVRGGLKKLGANVQVHERHNPVVDAELSADLFPDPEENEGEASNYLKGAQRYASGSLEDQVRAKAAQAYADAGIGFDEERFQKDFMLSNGKIKAKKDLPDHIRNQYLKTEKEFKQLKDDVELRQHMKERGIDKLKEFTGPHSNMRNQNMKYHRDLVDFYVKRKDWDKAQEVQDAYVLNEKNLDKFWGDKGRKNYDSLFQRPSRGGTSKKLGYHGIRGIGEGGEDIAIPMDKNRIDDVGYVKAMITQHSGKAAADRYQAMIDSGRGVSTYDASEKDTNIPSWKKQALSDTEAANFEIEIDGQAGFWNPTVWGDTGREGVYNERAISSGGDYFSAGKRKVHKSKVLTDTNVAKTVASSMGISVPKLYAQLQSSDPEWYAKVSKANESKTNKAGN